MPNVARILSLLPHEILLSTIYAHVNQPLSPSPYILRGIISFYGHHYIAFIQEPHLPWVYDDDELVIPVCLCICLC
jgi:hypothetical protein